MQRNVRITAFLFFLLTIFISCTKNIGLRTEVEFEVAVAHTAMGYIDEELSTNITVTPEAVLEDFSYSYSYAVSKGNGHFKDISGEILTENENIALNPFSAALTYIATEAGSHTIKIVASDNFGFSEEIDIQYSVEEVSVEDDSEVEEVDDEDAPIKSGKNAITAFAISGQTEEAVIDTTGHTISLDVPFGTELNVVPSVLTVSTLAEIASSEEGQRDFNVPVIYSVMAENGDVQQWTISVTVGQQPNRPPTVDAGSDTVINIILPDDSATASLDGVANDSDGTPTSEWTVESGDKVTIENPESVTTEVTGLKAGTYVFRLTAIDDEGATNTDTVIIRVNIAPTADAGSSRTVTTDTGTVKVSGLASDIDGIFTVKWTQVEITNEAATILNSDSLDIEITDLDEGLNVFELTVTDNYNAVTKDRMFVEVEPASN